jgi:hypothetical protein
MRFANQQNARPLSRGRANPRYHLICPHVWGPLRSEINTRLTQLIFRVIGRTRALLRGCWPFRRRLRGDILEGPGGPASIDPGLLFADWLGLGPRHCH